MATIYVEEEAPGFRSSSGRKVLWRDVVFPLVFKGGQSKFSLIGTGFYVMQGGFFLTADHCVRDDDNKLFENLWGYTAHNHTRAAITVYPHEDCDLALGLFDPNEYQCDSCIKHEIVELTERMPEVDDLVIHFGCEESKFGSSTTTSKSGTYSFGARYEINDYDGKYEQEGEVNCLYPWPHHFTGSEIPPGSSGGPVVNSRGKVIGINSSGMDGKGGSEPYTRVTRVSDFINGRLKGEIKVGDDTLYSPTVRDLLDYNKG